MNSFVLNRNYENPADFYENPWKLFKRNIIIFININVVNPDVCIDNFKNIELIITQIVLTTRRITHLLQRRPLCSYPKHTKWTFEKVKSYRSGYGLYHKK